MTKVGRNEPCPCGSGVKFKKCCDNPVLLRQMDAEDAATRDQMHELAMQEMHAYRAAHPEIAPSPPNDGRPAPPPRFHHRGDRRRLGLAMALALMGGMPIGPHRSDT